MYFSMKNYLKSNHNHTAKQTLNNNDGDSSELFKASFGITFQVPANHFHPLPTSFKACFNFATCKIGYDEG